MGRVERSRQKGAALIIVLLLVATLSIIAVGLSDRTLVAASRIRNEQNRTQMLWRLYAAETLAERLLVEATENRQQMSLDDPWVGVPIDLSALATRPAESGSVSFLHGGACSNVNALGINEDFSPQSGLGNQTGDDEVSLGDGTAAQQSIAEARMDEFAAMLGAVGISDSDARALGAVIRDWVDADTTPELNGAEDERYQRLPVPYRTGNSLVADVSELRAMQGVDAEFLAIIEPLLCALPTRAPARINVNMLLPGDVPVLAGLFGESVTLSDLTALIEQRPLGGYESVAAILNSSALAGQTLPEGIAERLAVSSDYLKSRIELATGNTFLEVTMLFRVQNGTRLDLVSRRIGSRR